MFLDLIKGDAIKLKFLGGVEGVTGSKTLLQIEKENYLIDYGLYQGGSKTREKNWADHKLQDINAIFLTHAHIDHSGLLPRLAKSDFKGKVYCTKATFKLCEILLKDSAKIHVEDAEYANRKNYSRHKPAYPLYTVEDANEILTKFNPVDFGDEINISENVSIKFHWAGHILGAAFLEVNTNEGSVSKRIVFSGDIGHDRSIVLKKPDKLVQSDILILESTYGNRLHARIPAIDVLGMYLNIILKRQGVAIIPSFSVGRTQDILYLINRLVKEKRIPSVPIILDSPLSQKANQIFRDCLSAEFIKDDVLDYCLESIFPDQLREVESVNESIEIQSRPGPLIVVSASGMLDGGRVVHHVKNRISDRKNGIILVGFQPEGTKGRILLDGHKMLRLHKEELPVEADIFYINSLSAHGDYLDIMQWIETSDSKPELIILNHGEASASRNLKILLESELNLKTTIALQDEEFSFD